MLNMLKLSVFQYAFLLVGATNNNQDCSTGTRTIKQLSSADEETRKKISK